MKIAVLGGGNGSAAAVVDAVEAGHDTCWCRRNLDGFGDMAQSRKMTLIDHKGTREVPVSPTDNLADGLS